MKLWFFTMLQTFESFVSGFDTTDISGNRQWRHERRKPDGRVIGNYGILDRNGQAHIVDYIADENGYRAIARDKDFIVQSNHPTFGDTHFLPLPPDPNVQVSRPFPDPPLHPGLIPYDGINFHPDVDITRGNVDIYPKPGPYPQIPFLEQNPVLFQPTGVHQLYNPSFPPIDDRNLKAIGQPRSFNSTLFFTSWRRYIRKSRTF
ncbi:uncharacterized protein LOC111085557 isoform X2 [Limulus polyphemus]|uniref:Uncharacterized protein LOC111085557 isoform X2 n=1 Tax=Limulus polyphemus TaxID=6850 RepID=A0ABM1S9V2_LIMPO|nr:uncharacterized protein LOC111085557 isoform X2 [Limulus polyphemus]